MIVAFCVFLPLSYLAGSIPFGLLFGRVVGKDVRQSGSGNIGATNVTRTLGKRFGVLTLVCDVAKGYLPVYGVTLLLAPGGGDELLVALCGLGAVVGHMFPVWLGFRGGKGVATALGVFLGLNPLAALMALLLFGVVVAGSGFVSAGSLLASGVIPLFIWYLGGPPVIIGMALLVAVLIWLKHLSNIKRLLGGTEQGLWGIKSP